MCDRASYMRMTRGNNLTQQLWYKLTQSAQDCTPTP